MKRFPFEEFSFSLRILMKARKNGLFEMLRKKLSGTFASSLAPNQPLILIHSEFIFLIIKKATFHLFVPHFFLFSFLFKVLYCLDSFFSSWLCRLLCNWKMSEITVDECKRPRLLSRDRLNALRREIHDEKENKIKMRRDFNAVIRSFKLWICEWEWSEKWEWKWFMGKEKFLGCLGF